MKEIIKYKVYCINCGGIFETRKRNIKRCRYCNAKNGKWKRNLFIIGLGDDVYKYIGMKIVENYLRTHNLDIEDIDEKTIEEIIQMPKLLLICRKSLVEEMSKRKNLENFS